MSERKPVGRPTDYKPEYVDQVVKLCKLGATDESIAEFFGIAVSTLNLWKVKHPEFMEAIKSGKVIADMEMAHSLYRKGIGYSYETERMSKDGDVVTLTEYAQPDTASIIFWLKNRAPDKWRDKNVNELVGKDDAPLAPAINVTLSRNKAGS